MMQADILLQNLRDNLSKNAELMKLSPQETPVAVIETKNFIPISSREKTRKNSTNLVIGMAQNTDPKNLVVFCASLRELR
jgi:hypothetical protein